MKLSLQKIILGLTMAVFVFGLGVGMRFTWQPPLSPLRQEKRHSARLHQCLQPPGRDGYALRIVSFVSPEAKGPSNRETGNRSPQMHGLPVKTFRSTVIRSL